MQPHIYKVHSTIISSDSWVLDFARNSCALKINKAQTKSANVKDITLKYNSRVSAGIGVNLVLSFLLL